MDPNAGYGGGYGGDPYAQHHGQPADHASQAGYGGYPPAHNVPPHQSYPPYAQQSAMPPAVAAHAYAAHDEIRTVFISGFPGDVKERELNNLLRFLPGYEASQMHWKNGQAQGFALFSNGASARAGRDSVQNLCFDETAVLRCEMAHKNMYFKDSDPSAKRPKPGGQYDQYGAGYGAGYGGYPPQGQQPPYQGGGGGAGANQKDNPPCNTLFIGNLGDHVNEGELRAIFSSQPGFSQLKMVRNSRNTTCFVEFHDVASAMMVHQAQQGVILQSSDRGGIRIQYSKNPFGKKRDATGQLVSLKSGEITSEPPMHSGMDPNMGGNPNMQGGMPPKPIDPQQPPQQ